MPQNKKHIIVLTTIFSIFIAFEIYGKQIAVYYFDTFHKRLCTDSFCINKPKGWIPLSIERDGQIYFLNIIPYNRFYPSTDYVEYMIKDKRVEMDFFKDGYIMHIKSNEHNENKFSRFKQYPIGNFRCYEVVKKYFSSMTCFDKNITIMQDHLDLKSIQEILAENPM